MQDTDSQYLASLDAQAKELDDKATALEAKFKADRDAIDAERAGVAQARKHFKAYLASKADSQLTLGPPGFTGVRAKTIPLPLRVGEQHQMMLNVLYYSREPLAIRAIAEKAGMQSKVVYTVVGRDIEAGILQKAQAGGIEMTAAGRDYMIRLTEKFGPPKQQKAPPAEAGGVFQ